MTGPPFTFALYACKNGPRTGAKPVVDVKQRERRSELQIQLCIRDRARLRCVCTDWARLLGCKSLWKGVSRLALTNTGVQSNLPHRVPSSSWPSGRLEETVLGIIASLHRRNLKTLEIRSIGLNFILTADWVDRLRKTLKANRVRLEGLVLSDLLLQGQEATGEEESTTEPMETALGRLVRSQGSLRLLGLGPLQILHSRPNQLAVTGFGLRALHKEKAKLQHLILTEFRMDREEDWTELAPILGRSKASLQALWISHRNLNSIHGRSALASTVSKSRCEISPARGTRLGYTSKWQASDYNIDDLGKASPSDDYLKNTWYMDLEVSIEDSKETGLQSGESGGEDLMDTDEDEAQESDSDSSGSLADFIANSPVPPASSDEEDEEDDDFVPRRLRRGDVEEENEDEDNAVPHRRPHRRRGGGDTTEDESEMRKKRVRVESESSEDVVLLGDVRLLSPPVSSRPHRRRLAKRSESPTPAIKGKKKKRRRIDSE